MRTLNAYEQIGGEDGALVMSSAVYWGLWAFRLVVAALCFGWATLKSVPNLSDSQEAVSFWRLRKQADSDMQTVSYTVPGYTMYSYGHTSTVCFVFFL